MWKGLPLYPRGKIEFAFPTRQRERRPSCNFNRKPTTNLLSQLYLSLQYETWRMRGVHQMRWRSHGRIPSNRERERRKNLVLYPQPAWKGESSLIYDDTVTHLIQATINRSSPSNTLGIWNMVPQTRGSPLSFHLMAETGSQRTHLPLGFGQQRYQGRFKTSYEEEDSTNLHLRSQK